MAFLTMFRYDILKRVYNFAMLNMSHYQIGISFLRYNRLHLEKYIVKKTITIVLPIAVD
jgi:hypothetical protein